MSGPEFNPADDVQGYPCAQYDETSATYLCEGSVYLGADGRWTCTVCGYDYGGYKEPDFTDL